MMFSTVHSPLGPNHEYDRIDNPSETSSHLSWSHTGLAHGPAFVRPGASLALGNQCASLGLDSAGRRHPGAADPVFPAQTRLEGNRRIALVGVLLVAALAVVASQAFATTPPIVDAQGKPLPGSIAALEKVTLNGSEQWISVRGRDTTSPVLLFLAGGPGGSQLATERYALSGLEEHFVVVNWEQPGAGKSFDAVDRATLTPERYVEDAHALALLLRERFGQEKIYVLGESWAARWASCSFSVTPSCSTPSSAPARW